MKQATNKQKLNHVAAGYGKTVRAAFAFLLTLTALTRSAFAEELKDSKIAKGIEKLLNDATNWLLVIAPSVAVLCIVYFLIRKAASDELDHKKCCARKCA